MILRPQSLEEMHAQLVAIPENKRRVLILVGRHLNEGTDLIAEDHHKKWERRGGVVVKIPEAWTPQVAWKPMLEKLGKIKAEWKPYNGGPQIILESSNVDPELLVHARNVLEIPHDRQVIEFLINKGINVPVINFHSSPVWSEPHLKWFTSEKSKLSPHPKFESYSDLHIPEDIRVHPNEVNLEYYCKGKENESTVRLQIGALQNHPEFPYATTQLGVDYLVHSSLSSTDRKQFANNHLHEFNSILKHLAGQKPRRSFISRLRSLLRIRNS